MDRQSPFLDFQGLVTYLSIRWHAWRNVNRMLASKTPYEFASSWTIARKLEEIRLIRDIEASQLRRLRTGSLME